MATITTDTYLDGGVARTAGEVWQINSGAKFTVRTDTRRHANSPASMTGSLGNQTINEGEIIYDGRNVRWLPISGGSGAVLAIGNTVSQGAVSGYFLGAYSSLTATPSLTIPATGFIKLREVSGGTFSAGALTFSAGTAVANATGADVTGWIEVVADDASTITVPRLGKHTIRGDWFYLDNTNGTVGQTIQTPTNGGGATTYSPGVWIETGVSTNQYEYRPSLYGATNGWAKQHLGGPFGGTDARQNFVKDIGSGQIQIGEAANTAGTYVNIAAQASTYATLAHSCTYTRASNIVTVTYPTGHLLKTGQTVGLDFTSGGATADGNYVITVLDAYNYTVSLTGSGASGNVTARPGVTVTFTAHTLGVGDTVYCDFTSGTGVDGDYVIYAVTSANAYLIEYPHTVALTAGNVSVHSRYKITSAAHGLAVGNRVYLDFTSGAGVDGIYTIVAVAANTFDVVMNNNGSDDTGNVTIKQTIGNIPPSGCRVRIPNVILRGCATGTRATNLVNATIANRPERATTSAGALDIEYAYSTRYFNINQPYAFRARNTTTYDTFILTECATAVDIEELHTSMFGALDIVSGVFTSNFAGGTVKNCKFHRGNVPGTTDHAVTINYCTGTTYDGLQAGIIQYVRSTGKAISVSYGGNLTFSNCRQFSSDLPLTAVVGCTVNNLDHCDRFIGYTNITTPYYAINLLAGCVDITINGITFGYGGTILNVHPSSGLMTYIAGTNILVKNIGSYATPLIGGTRRQNIYGVASLFVTGGNNLGLKFQRIYSDDNLRTAPFTTANSDKNVVYEHVYGGRYIMSAMAIYLFLNACLNSEYKGCYTGSSGVTGQVSVYGTHFYDVFLGTNTGRFILAFNEPTGDTIGQFTMVSGTAKFNSSGGLLLPTIGNQCIFEDSFFRKGHIGFANTTPVMSGGTITNYTLEYDIDIGSGYSGSRTTLSGANLSAITVNPLTGFKMKYRITTTSTNTTAITFLIIETLSSQAAQQNLYPLTTSDATFSFSGLSTGTEIVLFNSSNVELKRETIAGTTFSYDYTWNSNDGDITGCYALIWKNNKYPIKYTGISLTNTSLNIPISQSDDLVYVASSTDNVTIDFSNKLIIMDSGAISYNVAGIYSIRKDTIRLTNNTQYDFAFTIVGGNTISGVKSIPFYTFLVNGWKIRPDEANHTLSVVGGILVDSAGGDPFVDTLGAYTVRINYEQPVQAITVSTSGGGGATAAEVWSYVTRGLTQKTGFEIAGTKTKLDDLNDISTVQVNTEVDTALSDYDGPTKVELDVAVAPLALESTSQEIITNEGIINVGVQKASLLIPHSTDI